MTSRASILVVAATSRELATPEGWRTLQCGVGPIEAAARTAGEIARERPSCILHVGIAGGRRHAAFAPTTLVIGSESRYCDLAARSTWAPGVVPVAASLIDAARRACPDAVVTPIGTSAQVGGTNGCDVEAMEGFGVLRAAEIAGIPAIEVRAISNEIEEDDRARWHFAAAFEAVTAATPRLVAELLLAL